MHDVCCALTTKVLVSQENSFPLPSRRSSTGVPAISRYPALLIIGGVAGAGKSSLAARIAAGTGWPMIEGDDLHPAGNVEKMRRGEPLSDEDRWPWLEALAQAATGHLKGQKGQEGRKGQEVEQEDLQEDLQEGRETKANQQALILTCSALRRVYRDFLREAMPDGLRFVFPVVSRGALIERVTRRSHAYFPPELVASQLAAFEQPDAREPDCLLVDGERNLDALAEEVIAQLRYR
ncbi:MAG: hypothetical protein VXX87_07180 [Pseudomonadota bacterium]|nr:hypothetical protein [Pseudomonadota bacterium]